MEFLRVSSTADLRPRRVSRIFRFQSYMCERAPHAPRGDGVESRDGVKQHAPRAGARRCGAPGARGRAGGSRPVRVRWAPRTRAPARRGGGGRALTHPRPHKIKKSTSTSFSLIHKIFNVQHSRVLHSNAEIRTHQTCHLLMLTRVTESPIVEAPHERADHDAVACLALPAIAHAEDASVVGATGPF